MQPERMIAASGASQRLKNLFCFGGGRPSVQGGPFNLRLASQGFRHGSAHVHGNRVLHYTLTHAC